MLLLFVVIGVVLRQHPKVKTPFKSIVDKTVKLSLERSSSKVQFEKKGDQWIVSSGPGMTSYPADSLRMVRFTDSLRDFSVGDLISERKDRLAEFGIDESSRVHLQLADTSGKTLEQGYFGRMASDRTQMYFQYADQKGVFLATNIEPLASDVAFWRVTTIFAFPEPQISKIVIEAPGFKSELDRVQESSGPVEAIWTCNKKPADLAAVRKVVSAIAFIQSDGFADMPPDAVDAAKLTFATIRLTVKDGEHVLHVGALDAKRGMYPVKADDAPASYWLARTKIDALLVKPAMLTSQKK